MKVIKVILSPEAEEVYKYLNEQSPNSKLDRMILKSINKKIELIKLNPHFGDPISKDKIPSEYIKKYGITNLFRVELPNFWRMMYTLTNGGNNLEIISFVLEIVNHKVYNKRFGYKR